MGITSPDSRPITSPINGHDDYLLDKATWTASEAEAITFGGHLATINSAAENTWIASTFATYGSVNRLLWIGLNDAAVEGTFVWASGQPVVYLNWVPGEPNNNVGIEHYGGFFVPGDNRFPSWNDWPDDAYGGLGYGVVEVVAPVPEIDPAGLGSVLALVGGAIGLAERRRRGTARS